MSFVLAQSYAYAYIDAYVAHFGASFRLTFCLDPFAYAWSSEDQALMLLFDSVGVAEERRLIWVRGKEAKSQCEKPCDVID